jgi:hypothetical protein
MFANFIFWTFVIATVIAIIILGYCRMMNDITNGNYHHSVIPGVPVIYGLGISAAVVLIWLVIYTIGSSIGFFEYFHIIMPVEFSSR